ncbi:MAG: hypothetical protein A2431_02780 [Candidatus Zambryskibacteria bacterium RIFOXYC1_FULL_39_10]|uniref:Nudix hydrolase domain-containing protein n=1 Tax=Candidatus Zambryskibacteria bacterium RIFOXYC1_FULL_39_10 TaxID=1802779 RepID=A0A1G2UXZ9_9BACT|nr:MAG: hypothetical protein A2431_02780 [Candidatus Zambryskibacteria bacterium RIFOXYC1_FULL_39_10]OHB14803.1 MAG: hypothetical protein A2605_04080 [Candidatus Zambryskibacteria bacterium RIFOXYD1_FULL_39_35]
MKQSPICTAGIFVRDGKVLLELRNYEAKHFVDGDFWTTPGGRCDEGEEIETILSPHQKDKCSILLKRTEAKISYLNDQRSLLELGINKKAPGRD